MQFFAPNSLTCSINELQRPESSRIRIGNGGRRLRPEWSILNSAMLLDTHRVVVDREN